MIVFYRRKCGFQFVVFILILKSYLENFRKEVLASLCGVSKGKLGVSPVKLLNLLNSLNPLNFITNITGS